MYTVYIRCNHTGFISPVKKFDSLSEAESYKLEIDVDRPDYYVGIESQ